MHSVPIVYEDDDICIINKPSALAVQGGVGINRAVDTLLSEQLGSKIYLVHRLDRDTAGLLITAKNPAAASRWTKLIASSAVQKEYYALCTGEFSRLKGGITDPVVHKGVSKTAGTFFCVEKQSRIALDAEQSPSAKKEASASESALAQRSASLCFSLVRLRLETGRMHQIRIHLAGCGTPIAGDDKYGDFKLNRFLRKRFGVKKLHLAAVCLHFSEKCFTSCRTGAGAFQTAGGPPLKIEIPLPGYMNKSLELSGFAP
ncbi:RluA family pseudouridine synthase [Treponema sp. HNW]|uniref:RluA family pseudouridine synthase n=1 Tax=Treponema sp. HNW TaxID=3116654 RepID=UPI003D14A409